MQLEGLFQETAYPGYKRKISRKGRLGGQVATDVRSETGG